MLQNVIQITQTKVGMLVGYGVWSKPGQRVVYTCLELNRLDFLREKGFKGLHKNKWFNPAEA